MLKCSLRSYFISCFRVAGDAAYSSDCRVCSGIIWPWHIFSYFNGIFDMKMSYSWGLCVNRVAYVPYIPRFFSASHIFMIQCVSHKRKTNMHFFSKQSEKITGNVFE